MNPKTLVHMANRIVRILPAMPTGKKRCWAWPRTSANSGSAHAARAGGVLGSHAGEGLSELVLSSLQAHRSTLLSVDHLAAQPLTVGNYSGTIAVTSISTLARGSINALTCTAVIAG